MSFLSNLFSSGASDIVSSVGKAVDNLVTSDEERLKLQNELMKIRLESELKSAELANQAEQEITKRWESDNEHTITRLVRPVSYASVLVLFGSVILTDGNIGDFHVNSAYIPVLQTLLTTMTIAYFGGRSIEKYKRIKEK